MSEEARIDRVRRIKNAAERLGCSTKTIQRLIARDEIAVVRITDRSGTSTLRRRARRVLKAA